MTARRSTAPAGLALAALLLLASCSPSPPPPPSLPTIAQRWLQGLNNERWNGVLNLLDEDAIFWWPTTHPILRGKREVAPFLHALNQTWSEVEFRPNNVFIDEEAGKIAIDWAMRGVDGATGRPVVLAGVDLLEVRNGYVTAVRGVFDTAALPTPLPSPRQAP